MSIFIVQLGTPRKRGEGLSASERSAAPTRRSEGRLRTARLLRCMVSEPIAEPRTGT